MKARVLLSGLMVALLGLGLAGAQEPSAKPNGKEVLPSPTPEGSNNSAPVGPSNMGNNSPGPAAPSNGASNAAAPTGPVDLNVGPWIAYPRCNCCGPVGGDGPVSAEFYARTGASFTFGPGLLSEHTSPGFKMSGGVRTLLFNPAQDAAWTVDLGASTAWYGPAGPPSVQIRNPLATGPPNTHPLVPVTPKSLNESFFDLAFGRELYIWGNGHSGCDCTAPTWRVGFDGAVRWGTGKLSLQPNANFIPPRTGSIGAFLVSAHTDMEFPTGCCLFFIGLRAEYGWAYSDLLGTRNDTDLQTINVMLNFGMRY
jgi:hypothetical protein